MEIGREKNNKIKQCERVLSMRNIGITFGTSATNIEETEIRRYPRVTREGTHCQEGRLQRTKRTTKIPKIENCRLTIGRRKDEEDEETEERNKGNTWKIERDEESSIYLKERRTRISKDSFAGDERTTARTSDEEGVEEGREVPRDRNRRLVEGVGRGFGRHGDKQPPGPSQLVAGVGRKGWPRASAGQVRLGTQPECHSARGHKDVLRTQRGAERMRRRG